MLLWIGEITEDEQAETVNAEMPCRDSLCFLKWLAERYFLVEKSKVKQAYQTITREINNFDFYVNDIFGSEIGKEEE